MAVCGRGSLEERLRAEGATLALGFIACAVVVAAFGLLARETIGAAGGGPFDRAVELKVRDLAVPGGAAAMQAVSFFGSFPFLGPATLAVVGALALRQRKVSAALFLGSVLGGFGLEMLLKILVHRPRPGLLAALAHETTYSFPSGHATMSTVFFGGLAAVVFHVTPRAVPRGAAAAGAAIVITCVSFSRISLGVHWFTDVAGGVLVGLFWVIVSATATEIVAARGRVDDPG